MLMSGLSENDPRFKGVIKKKGSPGQIKLATRQWRSILRRPDSAHHKSTQSINHPNQINQLSQFLASIKSIPVIYKLT